MCNNRILSGDIHTYKPTLFSTGNAILTQCVRFHTILLKASPFYVYLFKCIKISLEFCRIIKALNGIKCMKSGFKYYIFLLASSNFAHRQQGTQCKTLHSSEEMKISYISFYRVGIEPHNFFMKLKISLFPKESQITPLLFIL